MGRYCKEEAKRSSKGGGRARLDKWSSSSSMGQGKVAAECCDQQSLFLARTWNQVFSPRISALFCRLAVKLVEQVCLPVASTAEHSPFLRSASVSAVLSP